MSTQLAQGLGPLAWDLFRVLALVGGAVAALLLLAAGWAGGRRRAAARRRRGLRVGPWPPPSPGARLLLCGGPVRLRAAGREVVVEDGGELVITRRRARARPPGARVVVAEGQALRVPLGELGGMVRPPPGRALWLVAGPAASVGRQLQPPLPRPGRRL
jgi:hypothetical protein